MKCTLCRSQYVEVKDFLQNDLLIQLLYMVMVVFENTIDDGHEG